MGEPEKCNPPKKMTVPHQNLNEIGFFYPAILGGEGRRNTSSRRDIESRFFHNSFWRWWETRSTQNPWTPHSYRRSLELFVKIKLRSIFWLTFQMSCVHILDKSDMCTASGGSVVMSWHRRTGSLFWFFTPSSKKVNALFFPTKAMKTSFLLWFRCRHVGTTQVS